MAASVQRCMRMLLMVFGAAGWFAVAQVHAGQSFQQAHESLKAKNPANTLFALRIVEPRRFREGELIRIEVEFRHPDTGVGRPPETRYQFRGVLLDPRLDCGDIEKPCWSTDGWAFSGPAVMPSLSDGRQPSSTDLNLYVPRLKPGRYRAALLAGLLVLTARGPLSASYGYADPPRYVVSNTVEFEVIPASPDWIRQSVAESAAILSAPPSGGGKEYEARWRAARQLRFLQHPLAWEASLDLLGGEQNELLAGLVGASDRDAVCRLMQARLASPGQLVSGSYLSAMGLVCQGARFPAPPRVDQKTPEGERVLKEWVQRTQAFESRLLDEAAASLAASLSAKNSGLQGAAIEALVQRALHVMNNEPGRPSPAWLPQLRREVTGSLLKLEVYRQRELLGGYWAFLRGPEMVPVLESILDRKPANYNYTETWRLALKRLNELDPARGRARLLAELRNPDTCIDPATLALLPPQSAPPMDSELIETLAAAQRRGGNSQMAMTMIARYATPEALPRIQAIYESQQDPCQPELMAYFLRADPAYAGRIFRGHPWDMHAAPPPCTVQYFERTARLFMHPVLERYMSAYLMHSDVQVKRTAAISLGRYGAGAAEAPLWDAFRYFHNYWNDRRAELPAHPEGEFLETELRNAIARGTNWLTSPAELRTIESLCISERCLYETQNDLRASQEPARLEVTLSGGMDFRGSVAQYYGFDSLEALEAKLAQFPRGSRFALRVWGPGRERTATELKRFASKRLIVVLEAPR